MTKLINKRYEPVEVLGRGGQGEVLKALDHRHQRTVALKVLHAGSGADRESLLAEARILLSLKPHPGMSLIREDFFEGPRYYLVMDWVDGRDLDGVLREQGEPGLPLATVVRYLSQVADVLDRLHANEPPIVHMDVKPSNLILTASGRVVLVDFGIAGARGKAWTQRGTKGYVAPEVAAGGAPTPSADVYGLAATAFALLTGSALPEPEALATLPPGIADALRKGLATRPDARPRTCSRLIEPLVRWLEETGRAEDASDGARAQSRMRWGRILRPIPIAAFLAVAVAAGSVSLLARREATRGAEADPRATIVPSDFPTGGPTGGALPTSSTTTRPVPRTGAPTGSGAPAPVTRIPLALPQTGSYVFSVDSTETRKGMNDFHAEDVPTTVKVARREAGDFAFEMSYNREDEQFPTHNEVAWIAYGSKGLSITHELFDVRGCDPVSVNRTCVATEADYTPWMLFVPYQAEPGRRWSGRASARVPGTNDEIWNERFSGHVLGWERLTVAGSALDVLVVDWRSDFSGDHNGSRSRKIWFSPAWGIGVKWTESMSWRMTNGDWYRSSATFELRRRPT